MISTLKKCYTEAGIAGKFRLLHKAHVELIIRATGLATKVHVFIVDLESFKRYASPNKLQIAFAQIFQDLGHENYQIHLIKQELSGEAWDVQIRSLAPNIEVMFDSKEVYGNTLIPNAFIKLKTSADVSVSVIEKQPLTEQNFQKIDKNFWQYLNKSIHLSSIDQNMYTLCKKAAIFYDASYCQSPFEQDLTINHYQTLEPRDFVNACLEQIAHHNKIQKTASRFVFSACDPVQILHLLACAHRENPMEKLAYNQAIKTLEQLIPQYLLSIDALVFLTSAQLDPNLPLLALYKKYNYPIKVLTAANSDDAFRAFTDFIDTIFIKK